MWTARWLFESPQTGSNVVLALTSSIGASTQLPMLKIPRTCSFLCICILVVSRTQCFIRPSVLRLLPFNVKKAVHKHQSGRLFFRAVSSVLWLIYIAEDGLGYGLRLGFLYCTELGSRDWSLSLCNVNMFCIVQCSHWVWNPNPYPSLSTAM